MSTYHLSPAGSDSAAGTPTAPWRTLAKAAATVSGGDEVVLRAGTYAGGVQFNDRNLLIRSYPGERAIISSSISSSSTQQTISLGTSASGTTLRGLEITGGYYYSVKLETDWSNGRFSRSASNITIEDSILHDSGRDVIKITPGCNDVTIRRNEIFNSGRRDGSNAEGIDNVNGDRMVVQDNHIHDIATNGLYPKGGASGAVIERNRIANTGNLGVALGYYTDAEFFDVDNTQFYESIDATVRNNVIVNTGHAGIGLYGSLRSRVYNNTVINPARSAQAGIMMAPGEVAGRIVPNQDVAIVNNIVRMDSGRSAVQIRASALTGTPSMGNNRYFRPGGTATFSDDRAGFRGSLSQWKARVASESTSTEGDPLLDADEHLTASSPAINAGRDLSSTGFADDFDGEARPAGAWDVGADEYAGVTNPPPPPADTTAPAISGTSTSGVTQTGATVRWTTDEPSTSQVQYGTTTAYGSTTTLDPTLLTSHAVTIGGLAAGTTYHYRVLSRDAAGNQAVSANYTLTTATAPPPPPATQFSAVDYSGDFANYTPRTASRWSVTTEASGEKRLTINTSAYDAPAEDLIGEYAILNGRTFGDFDATLSAKSNESLSSNPSGDYVVVFGYQDANNYSYLMMSGRAANTRFFRITNGAVTALPAATRAGIPDANWHNVTVTRRGSTVAVSLDGTQILSTTNAALGAAGGFGIGSYNDAASFDNVVASSPAGATSTAAAATTTFGSTAISPLADGDATADFFA